jgi:uncharacterized protein YecE (DUF72 family)
MQKELFSSGDRERRPAVLIGCAGWGLSSANKHLFPEMGSHLGSYAAILPCVEINTSFYRLHRPETYARWRDSVPDSFRFSVKLLRTITHFKRLQDCKTDLAQFLETVSPLEKKWGCLLVQFPPSFQFPGTLAKEFFSLLRELVKTDIVCEPRHPSWFQEDIYKWMNTSGISYVEADPPVAGRYNAINQGQETQYIRLHGSPLIYHSSYSEDYLDQLACTLQMNYASGVSSWCIFDNTASGAAIDNAISLLRKLNGPLPDINKNRGL